MDLENLYFILSDLCVVAGIYLLWGLAPAIIFQGFFFAAAGVLLALQNSGGEDGNQ